MGVAWPCMRKDLYSLRIIGPSKLAILRTLPLRKTGSNPSIGGSKILRVYNNFAHSWPTLQALERSKSYQRFVSG